MTVTGAKVLPSAGLEFSKETPSGTGRVLCAQLDTDTASISAPSGKMTLSEADVTQEAGKDGVEARVGRVDWNVRDVEEAKVKLRAMGCGCSAEGLLAWLGAKSEKDRGAGWLMYWSLHQMRMIRNTFKSSKKRAKALIPVSGMDGG